MTALSLGKHKKIQNFIIGEVKMTIQTLNVEKKLAAILSMRQLQQPHYENFIQRAKYIENEMNDKTFRITIVGEFSAGKSTFLNALIGQDILPHSVNETTATVTYIKNVKAADPLCNKVLIEFFNDQQPLLIDMPQDAQGLTDYVTTMATQLNVVEEVAAVTIHINFPYTDEPIEFVDTPGLNGVAEGHYERTRHEIQHAHMSIYLLSTRGLSQSNVQMYELLKQYQSSFVFVMNAIDTLKQSEGETATKKVAELRTQLQEIGVESTSKIIGVSSLLALTAKDPRMTKLSDYDQLPMTEERRAQLLEASNFKEIEAEIWERITREEKDRVKKHHIEQKLNALIEDIIEEFKDQVAIHEVEIDERQLKEIEFRIETAEESKEDILKTLKNFTSAKKSDIRSILLERVQKDVAAFYDQQSTIIHDKVKQFLTKTVSDESVDTPMKNFEQLHTALKKDVDQFEDELSTNYVKLLIAFLNEIYESAVLRIESHYPKITISKKKVNFQLALNKANLENLPTLKKIEQKEQKLEKLQLEQFEAESAKNKQKYLYVEAENEVNKIANQKKTLEKDRQKDIRNLGRRPSVETKRETYEVEKKGVFGWLSRKTKLGGYETRTRKFTDDSKQRAWDEKERKVKADYAKREDNLKRTLKAAEQRLSRYEESQTMVATRLEKLRLQVQSIENELRSLKLEKKEIYERNKQLYYATHKKETLHSLETYLKDTLANYYRQEIDGILNKEVPKLNEVIESHYMQSYRTYMDKLQRLKNTVIQQSAPAELVKAKQNLENVLHTLK